MGIPCMVFSGTVMSLSGGELVVLVTTSIFLHWVRGWEGYTATHHTPDGVDTLYLEVVVSLVLVPSHSLALVEAQVWGMAASPTRGPQCGSIGGIDCKGD